jgi:hypothetical protein
MRSTVADTVDVCAYEYNPPHLLAHLAKERLACGREGHATLQPRLSCHQPPNYESIRKWESERERNRGREWEGGREGETFSPSPPPLAPLSLWVAAVGVWRWVLRRETASKRSVEQRKRGATSSEVLISNGNDHTSPYFSIREQTASTSADTQILS